VVLHLAGLIGFHSIRITFATLTPLRGVFPSADVLNNQLFPGETRSHILGITLGSHGVDDRKDHLAHVLLSILTVVANSLHVR
jgi:hypothetical protein